MSLEKKKPVTASQRNTILLKKKVSNIKPLKKKTIFFKNNAGRNNQGKLTVFTKGGGHKKKYRIIDFLNTDIPGIVESIEYDPFRTANIARIYSSFLKKHFYIIAPQGLRSGNYINLKQNKIMKTFHIGNTYKLSTLPIGSFFYNLPFLKHKKGQAARSAGVFAQLLSRNFLLCNIRLPSGKCKFFNQNLRVTLGIVSNKEHRLINLGKAGRNRWLNRRPSVRGVAMNPIDHPHGGGEGKTSGGRPSVTPWGKPAHNPPKKK